MIVSKITHKRSRGGLFLLLLAIVLMLTACGPSGQPESPAEEPAEEQIAEESAEDLPVFTLEELAEFDGNDGRRAYVAVDGLVYDFTDLPRWSGGTHNGFEAGQDLTEALHEVSPHGDRVLSRAPIVGRLE